MNTDFIYKLYYFTYNIVVTNRKIYKSLLIQYSYLGDNLRLVNAIIELYGKAATDLPIDVFRAIMMGKKKREEKF